MAVALRNVREGWFSTSDVFQLGQARVADAVPALREQFAAKQEALLKGALASALVRLGAKEPQYWAYLVELATKAAENDAPSLFVTDHQGRMQGGNGKFAPEFETWARSRSLEPVQAAQEQLYLFPNYITYLGITGDPRSAPLLRKALGSRNYLVQTNAARGLAKLREKDSITLIIRACEKVPTDAAAMIAPALLFFDDARAQAAAERFIPVKMLESLRKRAKVPGADPFLN